MSCVAFVQNVTEAQKLRRKLIFVLLIANYLLCSLTDTRRMCTLMYIQQVWVATSASRCLLSANAFVAFRF